MKKMTCRDLGGGCDIEFEGETFEEIAMQSKSHGAEMIQQKDRNHLAAMQALQQQLKSPKEWQEWYTQKETIFNGLE